MLVTETLPKLQQYFLIQGVYIYFMDVNCNWDLDLSKNPYHVQRYMNELQDAHRTSAGLFLLVEPLPRAWIERVHLFFFASDLRGR